MLCLLIACPVAGFVLLSIFLNFRVKEKRLTAVVVKAVVSLFFILTLLTASLAAGENADWVYSALLGGGLVCGLLGDIWLDLKYIYKQDSDFWTWSGFICFMVGHFFYIAAIFNKFGFAPLALVGGLAAFAGAFAFVYALEKPMKMHYGKFKLITAVYGGILFFMFTLAFLTVIGQEHGNLGLLVLTVGGLFFIISDLILSGTYFGDGKDRPVDIIVNHTTYYIAQYCIAFTALLINMNI